MRRSWIMLLAVAMAVIVALPAGAGALDLELFCDKNPLHAKCPQDEPTTTTTTTTTVVPGSLGVGFSCAEYADLNPWSTYFTWDADENATFSVPALTSGVGACIDVSNTTAGSFEVDVTLVDEPTRNSILYALIKDSHPGDHCGKAEGAPGSALNLNLANDERSGNIDDVPAATLNACGTGYAEADVELNNDGEWVISPTTDQNDSLDPLAIMLGITGKPGITANITLTYVADSPR